MAQTTVYIYSSSMCLCTYVYVENLPTLVKNHQYTIGSTVNSLYMELEINEITAYIEVNILIEPTNC